MLKDGSRYDGENDGCATITKQICPGSTWTSVTFDDGYRNWYMHQDLVECRQDPDLPACVGDRGSWNAGYGRCGSYVAGRINHYYCSRDSDDNFLADEVCFECGQCESPADVEEEEEEEPCRNWRCRMQERRRQRQARREQRFARFSRRKARQADLAAERKAKWESRTDFLFI